MFIITLLGIIWLLGESLERTLVSGEAANAELANNNMRQFTIMRDIPIFLSTFANIVTSFLNAITHDALCKSSNFCRASYFHTHFLILNIFNAFGLHLLTFLIWQNSTLCRTNMKRLK